MSPSLSSLPPSVQESLQAETARLKAKNSAGTLRLDHGVAHVSLKVGGREMPDVKCSFLELAVLQAGMGSAAEIASALGVEEGAVKEALEAWRTRGVELGNGN